MTFEIPIPPVERFSRYHGGTELEFRCVGAETLCEMIARAGLRPDHRVIEIGSGVGRIARPLTRWLGPRGRYLGVEIIEDGISWCKENIGLHCPNFEFVHLDINNHFYNPNGMFDTASAWHERNFGLFDFAVFSSVFTHLDLADATFYLNLMRKLLVEDGTVYSSWFLVDEPASAAIRNGSSIVRFGYEECGLHYLSMQKSPAAIGYSEPLAVGLFDAAGLKITELAHGAWCGRSNAGRLYQDVIIARRVD